MANNGDEDATVTQAQSFKQELVREIREIVDNSERRLNKKLDDSYTWKHVASSAIMWMGISAALFIVIRPFAPTVEIKTS